jgi:hypothetical protein
VACSQRAAQYVGSSHGDREGSVARVCRGPSENLIRRMEEAITIALNPISQRLLPAVTKYVASSDSQHEYSLDNRPGRLNSQPKGRAAKRRLGVLPESVSTTTHLSWIMMHSGTQEVCGSRSGCCASALRGGFRQESAGDGDLRELRGSATLSQAADRREPPLGRRPTSIGALEYRKGRAVPAEVEHPTAGLAGERQPHRRDQRFVRTRVQIL